MREESLIKNVAKRKVTKVVIRLFITLVKLELFNWSIATLL